MESQEMRPIWEEEEQISMGAFNWNNLQQPQANIQEQSMPESEEKPYDSDSQKREKKLLGTQQISQLHLKKKNLSQFISNIESLANEPISRDILSHCQKISSRNYMHLSPDSIVKLTKNRVEKMIKNKRIKKNWSEEDIKILVWVVSKYCQMRGSSFSKDKMEENDWEFIANLIPGVTPKNCMFKWLSLKKNNLASNNWVQEQSNILNQLVKQYGLDKWGQISEELYEKNTSPLKIYRCPKQCRQHWNCYLDPKLKKGPWQKKQDVLLLKSVQQLDGAKKWAQIVKLFNGRTQNALKNRYNLIIEKQYKESKNRRKHTEQQIIQSYLKKYQNSVTIQLNKLALLREKKQLIIQSKKCLNEIRPSRRASRKSKKYVSDSSEEYDPNQWMVQGQRDRVKFEAPRINKNEKFGNLENHNYHSFHFDEQQASYNNLFKERKDYDEAIFEEQQQIPMQQEDDNKMFPLHDHQDHPEDKTIKKNNTMDDVGTNQQNLNIDMNRINVVSLDQDTFEKLKNQFSQHKTHIFPCKVTEDNFIVNYRPMKQ